MKFPASALPKAQLVVAAYLTLEVAHPNAAGLAYEAVVQAAWAFKARVHADGGPLRCGAPPASALVPAPAPATGGPFAPAPAVVAPGPASAVAAPAPRSRLSAFFRGLRFFTG